MNKNRQPNFMVVNTETPMSDIEGKHYLYSIDIIDNSWVTFLIRVFGTNHKCIIGFLYYLECLKNFIKRDDIDIILINQNVAEMVRHVIDTHTAPVPAILEIPSKDHPYDPSKDSILRRAKGLFNPDDMR